MPLRKRVNKLQNLFLSIPKVRSNLFFSTRDVITSPESVSQPPLQTSLGMGLNLPPIREPLYKPSPRSSFAERYYHLLNLLGVFGPKASQRLSSDDLFRSIEDQATQEAWFKPSGLGSLQRSWVSEHTLIAIHVWIIHNRLKVDYNINTDSGLFSGRRMMEELFSRFWEDTTLRIRNAGVQELSVNRQLENVQRMTFNDFYEYDEAIKVEDDDNMELATAIWRSLFREAENADVEAVLRMADYVKREVVSVLLQPKEDIYRGWVLWGPCLGETYQMRIDRKKAMLEGEWRDALDPTGKVFFYHTSTQERKYEVPSEGLYERRRFALLRHFAMNPEEALMIGSNSNSVSSGLLEASNTSRTVDSPSTTSSTTSAKEVFGSRPPSRIF